MAGSGAAGFVQVAGRSEFWFRPTFTVWPWAGHFHILGLSVPISSRGFRGLRAEWAMPSCQPRGRLVKAQPSPRAAEGRRGVMWGDGPFPFDTSQLFEGRGRSSTCPMCMVAPVLTALWTECFPDMDGGHRYWEPKTDAGGLEGEIHDASTSRHQASWPKGAGRVTSHSP